MTGHNLIQAVNRVATVFRDKPSGLIVDYIGIGDRLRDATKKYTGAGGTGAVAFDMEEAFSLAQEMIELLREQLPESFKIQPSLASGECALRAASGRFETLPELPLQGPEA